MPSLTKHRGSARLMLTRIRARLPLGRDPSKTSKKKKQRYKKRKRKTRKQQLIFVHPEELLKAP